MRLPGILLLALILLPLLGSCHKANTAQLPQDWPLKRLGLPRDSKVFEGHVNSDVKLGEGGTGKQWTVFFTCPEGWDKARASVERELAALSFLRQDAAPTATPVGSGPISFSSAYATSEGQYLVVLVYEESAESREKVGGGYYTLMVQVNTPPLPPGEDFKPF